MYIELIGGRVLCVSFVLRVHCTFDGDGGSKLQTRSCLSCVFSIILSNKHFFSNVFHMFKVVFSNTCITSSIQNIIF